MVKRYPKEHFKARAKHRTTQLSARRRHIAKRLIRNLSKASNDTDVYATIEVRVTKETAEKLHFLKENGKWLNVTLH